MLTKTLSGLRAFVKDQCVNLVSGGCLFEGECLVLTGKRCQYFERAVLGPADYKYRVPGYDYEKIFEQYGRINFSFLNKTVKIRRCECGATLNPRQRCCEKCARRKRRESQRKYNRKRTVSTTTVN